MRRRLRLAARAQEDLGSILAFTRETFGPQQADIYADAIRKALVALCDRPDLAGSRPRDEVARDLRSFHVGRLQTNARHVIYFRATNTVVNVARILHERMDIARHIEA